MRTDCTEGGNGMNGYCSCGTPQYSCPQQDQTQMSSYVKVVVGGFTDELKDKLEKIEDFANRYVLPNATEEIVGGIKVGDGLKISDDGTLSVDPDSTCDCGDSQIMDGGDATGEVDFIRILDGGNADGI